MRIPQLLAPLLLASSSVTARVSVPHDQKPLAPAPVPVPASFEFGSPATSASSSGAAPSYRDALVALHKSLVDIQSITYDENKVARFLVSYLRDHGFTTDVQRVPAPADAPDSHRPRYNVLAWPATSSAASAAANGRVPLNPVLVSSHIDTVPPYIPYSRSPASGPLDRDTLIAGRGSADAKASVAAQIVAAAELLGSGAVDPEALMLLFVVGEERSGDGMKHFSESIASPSSAAGDGDGSGIRAAIFGEPTEGRLACGHKGMLSCVVRARGRAGHSGYPWLGKSATEALARGVVAVLDADLGSSELFGATTVNVGRIEGGVAANVIPERAEAQLACRVAVGPEEGGSDVVEGRLRAALAESDPDPDVFDIDCKPGYGVVKCDCDVDGFETITTNYGTDVHNLKGNHTRYLYGPGTILVAHGPDEAIRLGDLEDAVEGYKKLILHALDKVE